MNMRRLAELPLFAGLDEDALRAIGASVTEESVEEGRAIVREGDFSQDLTIIDEGRARVERDGQELAELGPGDTFGEQGLISKAQRNATVRALTDMRLIHLTKFDLNRLKGAHPQLVERIEQIAQERAQG
jgi:CRP-like cAMP-binding protein